MGLGGYDALVYSTGREADNAGALAGAHGGVGVSVQSVMPRAFALLLMLLLASFFFVPEQHQRNWLLYLAALAAHGFLLDRAVLRRAYAGRGGWAVAALLALPVLSLAWGDSQAFEDAADLLLAAYCILAIHLGVAGLAERRPQALDSLRDALLLAANLGALLCIGHWALNYEADAPRLTGGWGWTTRYTLRSCCWRQPCRSGTASPAASCGSAGCLLAWHPSPLRCWPARAWPWPPTR